MKQYRPVFGLIIVLLATILLSSKSAATQGPGWQQLCPGPGAEVITAEQNGDLLVTCNGGEPMPTNTPTPEPTLTPTPEPTLTPTPEPIHDTTMCHGADTGDGHTHGICLEDLPDGPVKDFHAAHPEWYDVGAILESTGLENMFPYPGKHAGFKYLFFEAEGCPQGTDQLPTDNPEDLCFKSAWFRVHSLGIAESLRTPTAEHSALLVAELCSKDFSQCDVIALPELHNYGEVHSVYKQTGCPGIEGGVEHPPEYSINHGAGASAQPPYVANAKIDRGQEKFNFFWSSLRNAVLEPTLPVNNLFQLAWHERAFEAASDNPDLCADPAHDVLGLPSTDLGFENIYLFHTIIAKIEDYPRPFEGFVDPHGNHAPDCVAAGPECLPMYIGADVPPGNGLYNLPVRQPGNPDVPLQVIIDITEPGVHMPGYEE